MKKMENDSLLQAAKEQIKFRKYRKWYYSAFVSLAAVVVFCTTYMLIMPAITLEADRALACTYEVHQHNDSCFDENGNVMCGYADYVVHTHDPEYCYDEDGNLICKLSELKPHRHDAACYEEQSVLVCEESEDGGHVHNEACYTGIQGELICEITDEGHEHSDECYRRTQELICALEEGDGAHRHSGDCYETRNVLTCDKQEVILHTHTEDCYEDILNGDGEVIGQTRICGLLQVEEHQHNKDCLANKKGNTVSEGEKADSSSASLAYIDAFSISRVIDGSDPLDKTGEIVNGSVDTPGNDNGKENRVVRSFDSIEYNMQITLGTRDEAVTLPSVQIGFELSLYKGATAAEFNTEDMSWLEDGWQIEYLDADSDVILVKDSTGLYKWDAKTNTKGEKTSLNSFVNGSDNSGGNAYMVNNGIVQQKLTGTYTIEKEDEGGIAGAQQTLTAFINVLAATNGETFEPSFKVWAVGNEQNLNKNGQASSINEIKINKGNAATSQYVVTVSAAARYNVLVKNSGATNYLGYFDFSTGKKAESASDTAAYGRMLSWGITLQLYNETDSPEPGARFSKGYRGIELPVNGITFDLALTSSVKSGADNSELTENYHFSPYLWDYHANDTANSGTWGRNLYWGNNDRTRYAKSVSPYNNSDTKVSSYGSGTNYCYNGGKWTLTSYAADGTRNDGTTKTGISSSYGDGSGTVYSFSVSGYDFDFDNFLSQFPLAASGDSGASSLLSAPAYSFSAGHIQVLQRFDENYNGEFTAYVNAAVSNLRAQSKTNQNAQEIKTTDNSEGLSVVKYSTGSYAKYISFTDREANDGASGANKFNYYNRDYFLGGSNLETRSDDASAYAGSDIYMFSRGYRTSGDGYINAINILQKFDSKVLSIDTSVTDAKLATNYGTADPKQPWFAWYVGFANSTVNAEGKNPGTATWLYVADPLWPEGYDTNAPEKRSFTKNGVTYDYTAAQRMAFAQEEDLIYFESLNELEAAGYTCIGVLMEVRNCSLEAGSNTPTLRVAMKISPDAANIGSTVSTTAIVRNWLDDGGSMSDISWKNGSANHVGAATGGEPVANTLTDGAGDELKNLTAYGTCVALTQGSGPAAHKLYVKSEYDSGNIVTGTHYNGYTWGMSVFIIGYKSYLYIDVGNVKEDNDGDGAGNPIFEIDKGEWTAKYTISNIHTEATEDTIQSSTTNLKLTVTAPRESGIGADDGLTMVTSSFKIKTTDDEGNPTYTGIGIGENNATEFKITYDGKEYTCAVYVVFDSEGRAFIYLKNVPICTMLPDIVFNAEIGSGVSNNADLTVSAAISGDQDGRAQTADNGNYVTETIRISTLSSSSLMKKVEEALIELDGEIHYTIAYSNTGAQSAIEKMYLYDLMPYNGDIRSSNFKGTVKAMGIEAYLSDAQGNIDGVKFTAYARFYYSTVSPEILKRILGENDFDNMPETDGIYLQALLDNALVDEQGNVYFFLDENGKICDLYKYSNPGKSNEQITGANFDVDSTTRYVTSVHTSYAKLVQVSGVTANDAGGITLTSTDATFTSDTYKKMFRHYGYIDGTSTSASITPGVGADEADEFGSATCIFARVTNLSASRTLNIEITVKTDENAAGDIYGNKAHSTIAGITTSQLSSNTVKTKVVSRRISGVVWYDWNLNGVRDTNVEKETPLTDVTVTLFKKNESSGEYEPCEKTVNGVLINTIITKADGAYSFENLAEGDYIVAFSGEALKPYTSATSYQQNKSNDSDTNDGMAISELKAAGIDKEQYTYFIRYSAGSDSMLLHSITDMGSVTLNNSVEAFDYQDLGVIIAGYELPATGGSGTILYTIGGLLLMALPLVYAYRKRKGERRAKLGIRSP